MIPAQLFRCIRRLPLIASLLIFSNIPAISATGDRDSTFAAVVAGNDAQAIAIQADGRILVGGRISSVDWAPREGFVRLYPDGTADHTFDPALSLKQIGVRPIEVDGIKIQPDGRILASGWFLNGPELIRFLPDGSYDPSFQMPPGGFSDTFALLPDGKVLVAGSFWVDGVHQDFLRLNSDGTIDTSFQSGLYSSVSAIAVQNDGSVLLGGYFTTIGGTNQARLARLLPNGSVDTSFTPTLEGPVGKIAIQHDQAIIVAIGTSSGNVVLRRYTASGELDPTFSATISGNAINSLGNLVVQANGRIFISGSFGTVNGVARNGIARLLPGGGIDTGFVVPNTNYFTLGRVVLQTDGKILLGGAFDYWANVMTSPPIRLLNDAGDSLLSTGVGTVQWQITGTSPVIEKTQFEYRDAINQQWIPFGTPVRTSDGWSASTAGLPAAGTIRVTGTASSDRDSHALSRKMVSYGGAQSFLTLANATGTTLASGSTVNLGNTLSGYSKETRFSIRNPGPGALTGISFAFSGSGASQFSITQTSTVPVGPGEELPFSVRFSPSSTGSQSATLTVSSNAASGPFTLNLSGAGSNTLNPRFDNAGEIPIRTDTFNWTGKSFGSLTLGFAPPPGTVLTVIDQFNYSAPTTGFADLPDGGVITASYGGVTYQFLAGYKGSAPWNKYGIDFTLTLIGPGCPRTDFSTAVGNDSNLLAVSESGRMAHLSSGSISIRLNRADGSTISTFAPVFRKNGNSGYVYKIVACPGGTFLAAGSFTTVNGIARNSLAKFDWDGNLIKDFIPAIGTEWINTVAVQNDGKILVSGGETSTSVIRLNPDGSRDAGFAVTTTSQAGLLAPLANGQILMAAGERSNTVNGVTTSKLVRLNPDGSLDTSFLYTSDSESGTVGIIAEQADGRVVLSEAAGISNSHLRRILSNGTADSSFQPKFINDTGCRYKSVSIQSDGGILIGGYFSEVSAQSRSFMVRLHQDGSLDPVFVSNGGESSVLVLGRDGGILTNGPVVAGVTQTGLVKLRNDPGQIQLEHPNSSSIRLSLQGTAPLVRTSFAFLATGASEWTQLPAPIRTATGWELTGLSLPPSGVIRSRSIPSSQNSSSSVIEQFLDFGSAAPDIAVRAPSGALVPSGGGFDFGPVLVGYSRVVKFRVTNDGDGFWDHFGVSFTGPDASSFSLVSMPDYGLLPGETGTFEIAMSPGAAGAKSATMVLAGNDPSNNPFPVSLGGLAGTVMSPKFFTADDVALRSSGFATSGKQFGTLTLGFQPQPGTVLLLVDNTGSSAISGTFSDLADGSVVTSTYNGTIYQFVAGYRGGDGNDLVLTLLGPGVVNGFGPGNLFSSYPYFISFSLPLSDGGALLGGDFNQIAGNAINYLAKIRSDGTPDTTFKPNPNQPVTSIHRYSDGSLLIAGDFTTIGSHTHNRLARLKPDGSRDASFTPSVNARIEVMKLQSDGRILIGGSFTSVNGATRYSLARLNPDGSLDTAFNPNVIAMVRTIAIQDDGRILIGGQFTNVGGSSRYLIARLESNGSLDTTFNPAFTYGSGTFEIRAIHIQSDGSILVGSTLTKVNGITSEYLCRLLPSGAVDPSFHGSTSSMVTAIQQLTDGRILIGGSFNKVNGAPKVGVAMLNPDGTLDDSFHSNVTATSISQFAIHANGAIDVAGTLTTANGVARNGYVRLVNESTENQFSNPSPGTVRWTGGPALPIERAVAFEQYNPSSGTWSQLADATRGAGFWEASSLALPPAAAIRARTTVATATATYDLAYPTGVLGNGPAAITVRNTDGSPTDAAGVAFGALPLSWSSDRTFNLTNDGLSVVNSLTLAVSGPQASDFTIVSSPAGPIAPGETKTFTIRFAPTSSGARQALLTVSTDNPATPVVSIPLGGDGGSVFSPRFHSATDIPVSASSADLTGMAFGGLQLDFAPEPGTVLVAIKQTGSTAFNTFLSGLANTGTVTATFGGKTYDFTATYTGGDTNDLAFILQTPGGADPNSNIGTNQSVTAIANLPDGGKVLAGSFTDCAGVACTRIARILADGSVDSSFRISLSSAPSSMSVQRDGRILVPATATAPDGTTRSYLARIQTDGTLDSSFNPQTNGSVATAIELRSGKILIGGTFTSVGGVTRYGLARLNANGTLDTSFTANPTGTYRWVSALVEQADGKILVGGNFTGFNSNTKGLLARLEPSGALDTGFDAGFVWQNPNTVGVVNLLCQPDGRILVSGLLTPKTYSPTRMLTRLESNGSRDLSFSASPSTYADAMLLQRNGGIVIGGSFTSVGDRACHGLARLTTTGVVDTSFQPDPTHASSASTKALAEDSNGRILAGGTFKSMNGLGASNFSMLSATATAADPRTSGSSLVEWPRAEAFGDLEEVQFDLSIDSGDHWTSLGTPARSASGWEIPGLILPLSGQLRVTARTLTGKPGNSIVSRTAFFQRQPTAQESWRENWFGDYMNQGDGENGADYDQDGLTNLLEFALGLNPIDGYDRDIPTWKRVGDGYELQFHRPFGTDGIIYAGEWSDNLGSGQWQPAQVLSDGEELRFRVPVDNHPKLFFRLRVKEP